VVSGKAPTSLAVYVGLFAALAQEAISPVCKYPLKAVEIKLFTSEVVVAPTSEAV